MEANCMLEANGLKLIAIRSIAASLDPIDWDKLQSTLRENFAAPSNVVAWLDYKVLIGLWQNQDFLFHENETFDLKYVQRLRVFDKQKELLVWRSNGGWKGRLRIDDQGEETDVVVAHQLLFGTRGERLSPQFAKLEEDRGTTLVLPLKDIDFDEKDNPSTRVFIKTRNYIKINAVHQAGYCDCRFVAFTDGQNELS